VIDKAAFRKAMRDKPIFTKDQGDIALARHGLGALQTWEPVDSNMINVVYKATSSRDSYFVKIQFRTGFSLKTQSETTQLIRASTQLPVCDICILDEETEPFGHPFLISNQLQGQLGRGLFETGDASLQRQILKEYGKTVAQLHAMNPTTHNLPTRTYRNWKNTIRTRLLDNDGLIAALPKTCQERIPIISELLDRAEVNLESVPQGFIWGDAVLHNMFFDRQGNLTGIIDFENSAWGDLLFDQLHMQAEFRRSPQEVYGQKDYPEELWRGYEQAGGIRPTPSNAHLAVRKAEQASGFSWMWNAMGVFPPQTPTHIEELENTLRALL